MSDIIRQLPDSVANQIAAGEVIQRPASVIKELVENSIDAHATAITIVLKDAGRTLIQVIDNGMGMTPTDARMAFERHATSKIQNASDLYSLHTMGFRGEALASIAAIAQVTLITMPRGETLGTRIEIAATKVESQTPEACAEGSNLSVKNIFYNLPARRKFLKKDPVELSAIMREFERMALVNPDIDFTIIHNDVTLFSLRGTSLKQRISDLFGKSVGKQLIPIDTDTSIVRLHGFIGLPENARRRNALQYLMVNGRNMRHPYFHKAIMQCYEQILAHDMQPNYFLNLTVDPETIDINIHPTKNEIKFENEQPIWQILTAAVKESLGRFNAVPSIDFDAENVPDIPVFNPDANARHNVEIDHSYNPFNQTDQPVSAPRQVAPAASTYRSALNDATQDWDKLFDDFTRQRDQTLAQVVESGINTADAATVPTEAQQALPGVVAEPMGASSLQLRNAYILTSTRDGLMIIDQHRAHVKILYDRYVTMRHINALASQKSMFPEVITLSPAQNAVMETIVADVAELGFDVANLGQNAWSINGTPAVLEGKNAREVLLEMIETVTDSGASIADSITDKVALAMARSAAIKRGRPLTADEADIILADLFKLPAPALTPDGNKVFAILPNEEITKMLS